MALLGCTKRLWQAPHVVRFYFSLCTSPEKPAPRLPLSAVSPLRQQHVVVAVLVVGGARHCVVNLDGVQIWSARFDRATGTDWHCKCAGRAGYPSYQKAQFANKTQARGGRPDYRVGQPAVHGTRITPLRTEYLYCVLTACPVVS
jgi:hypothetical protein